MRIKECNGGLETLDMKKQKKIRRIKRENRRFKEQDFMKLEK